MDLKAFEVLSPVSFYSFGAVLGLLLVARLGAKTLLPANASRTDRVTFIWLAFDGLVHLILEASFLYLNMSGGTVNTGKGPFAAFWQEYAKADRRWGEFDPTVISLEILTVIGGGFLCFFILGQMILNDPARHYWIIVLCTAEIYGGWMTFAPEWLTQSRNLVTDNPIYLWLYLVIMNIIWVFLPLWLMFDSYLTIAESLRYTQVLRASKRSS